MEIDLKTLAEGFSRGGFVIDEPQLKTVYLALKLEKPLLVSGPPGVGKTALARILCNILHGRLIRLQCHQGLDESSSLYDWNIQRQLVEIHLNGTGNRFDEDRLFSRDKLLQRPLLQAITSGEQAVLLIDEIDRSAPSFEAYLLEILSDFQVTIPEIGTIKAERKPVVVITNDGERELSEALKRRCVFLYLDFPGIEQEAAIIRAQIPDVLDDLNEKMSMAVALARDEGFHYGYDSATLEWARAMLLLNADRYQRDYINKTLSLLAKNRDNLDQTIELLNKSLDKRESAGKNG